MSDFKTKYEKNKVLKEMVLKKLKEGPFYFKELRSIFDLERNNLSNLLMSLKYFNLIEIYHEDLTLALNKRRWIACKDAGTYEDALAEAKQAAKEKTETKPLPHARVIEARHSTGSKTKLNPWSGYTSF